MPGYAANARLHAALAVMALLSLLILYRQAPLGAILITLLMFYYAAFHTMYVVLPRFSVPVWPLAIVLAAAFPVFATTMIREKLANRRILGNALVATALVALASTVLFSFLLQRHNSIQEGSFEFGRAGEVWFYEESAEERDTSLVIDEFRAHDGFRAAVLEIIPEEKGLETRVIQIVNVWFDTTYRLQFAYYFTVKPTESAPLFVEIRHWNEAKEQWEQVSIDYLPAIASTWTQKELEFEVGRGVRTVAVVFGLKEEPSQVLLDDVRLEIAEPVTEFIERPYLLEDPREVHTFNFVPLDEWVRGQPEENRSYLLANPDVAREHGWREVGSLQGAAIGFGAGGLVAWVVISLLFIRVRILETLLRARLVEVAFAIAIVLMASVQAATCYELLFSRPI